MFSVLISLFTFTRFSPLILFKITLGLPGENFLEIRFGDNNCVFCSADLFLTGRLVTKLTLLLLMLADDSPEVDGSGVLRRIGVDVYLLEISKFEQIYFFT